ncbi:MAG: transcription-repair coupling factor [Alphaproteobacteria bacterium]
MSVLLPDVPSRTRIESCPDGADGPVLAEICKNAARPVLAVFRDEGRMLSAMDRVGFFAPDLPRLALPAWDCLPYDRVSPNADSVAARLSALCELARGIDGPYMVATTVSSVLQKLPPRDALRGASLLARQGDTLSVETLQEFFARTGYRRANTVREPGEFAIRGGLVDLFPPGAESPFRLDFFGDEIESLRRFDAMTQRTLGPAEELVLHPVSEVMMDQAHIDRFRQRYREMFGGEAFGDPLFEAVSEGRRVAGVEHWLPLFHDRMESLFDWLPDSPVVLEFQADEAISARLEMIADHYQARVDAEKMRGRSKSSEVEEAPPYRPLPVEMLYVREGDWNAALDPRPVADLSPYRSTDASDLAGAHVLNAGFEGVTDFSAARKAEQADLFHAVRDRIASLDRPVLIAAGGEGARERLKLLLREASADVQSDAADADDLKNLRPGQVALAVFPLETGFQNETLHVLSEQDILGEKMARPRRRRRGEEFISELSAIETGDLVVHVDHGIGRYDGLQTIDVDGAPHDCLKLTYAGDDRLFLPVENLEVLSKYGSEDTGVQLDKLGGAAWQARKARMKERVREIAEGLMKIAAERALRKGSPLVAPEGAYDEFCARFAFTETDDQLSAIADVLSDLSSGKPMDRLICGDVGFGKTEVALRAAFLAVMAGHQVAVVVPTTLLARQHFRVFEERFSGLPVKVAQLSRLVTGKAAEEVRAGLADGTIDIVVGTHAVLAKSTKLRHLGLIVVDEEQHFGVQQKERLKQMRADVHVLTLTATPIPRTLQMALAGVREMSIIASPPVDRLAVRTFALPFDPVVLGEAIRRERFRGGQIFYVCPRVADLDRVRERIREIAPDCSVAVAHGRLSGTELETVMSDFVAGRYDILLSTNIVESGLDIPNANTMIIHRADMFGLSQLYQLRGRIGRGKQRAYCYLTLPPGKILTEGARKRLEVMQTLDSLGAGFTLASHDLDIRGAGNLVGEEQSGHIKEVGVELYQRMLEEAVAAARDHIAAEELEETWTPTIQIGIAVLIPEGYVQDLSVRLGLYRRLSDLRDRKEIDHFAVELVDRFGPMPEEVENLLEVVAIKQACKAAGIDRAEAGPKGALISFRNDSFANPAGLIGYIQKLAGAAKLRPDHKMVVMRPWIDQKRRLNGLRKVAEALAKIAG